LKSSHNYSNAVHKNTLSIKGLGAEKLLLNIFERRVTLRFNRNDSTILCVQSSQMWNTHCAKNNTPLLHALHRDRVLGE